MGRKRGSAVVTAPGDIGTSSGVQRPCGRIKPNKLHHSQHHQPQQQQQQQQQQIQRNHHPENVPSHNNVEVITNHHHQQPEQWLQTHGVEMEKKGDIPFWVGTQTDEADSDQDSAIYAELDKRDMGMTSGAESSLEGLNPATLPVHRVRVPHSGYALHLGDTTDEDIYTHV